MERSQEVQLVGDRGTEQIIRIKKQMLSIAVVEGKTAADLPQIQHIKFSYGLSVHPLPIAECTSDQKKCKSLYDGVATHWSTDVTEAYVNFTFGDASTSLNEPRHVNRFHVRYAAHRTSQVTFKFIFDGGLKTAKIEAILNGRGEGTFHLPLQRTKSVRMEVTKEHAEVELHEIAFWYAKVPTKEDMQWHRRRVTNPYSSAGSTTALAEWSQKNHQVWASTGTTVGFFDKIANAFKLVAMGVCLAAIGIVQAVLLIAKFVVNGIASAIIAILEAAIALMGPRFFKINDLMIKGSIGGLSGGVKVMFGFNIDMYLLGMHIGPWGFEVEFSILALLKKLFEKVKDGFKSMRL